MSIAKDRQQPSSKPRSTSNPLRDFKTVSQFTLFGSVKKGNKPDFHGAAPGDKARQLYDYFLFRIGELYRKERVKDGVFGAMMQVALVNDGPVSAPLSVLPMEQATVNHECLHVCR